MTDDKEALATKFLNAESTVHDLTARNETLTDELSSAKARV
jgi:hypothetical protein